MAYKISPNSLIRCSQCGEDYSATYRRCPFCGARNTPPASSSSHSVPEAAPEARPASGRSAAPVNLEDTYVFDGQDLFDDEKAEEDYAPVRPRGGKRLAEKPSSNPFANADINWPRLITFICSLVIIVAAMVIVFAWIYPQLRGNRDPAANDSQSPSSSATQPGSDATPSVNPSAAVSDVVATDPVTEPTDSVPPSGSAGLKGFTTNTYGNDAEGFTLAAGGSWQMRLTFDPADWSGEVTYRVSDTRYATVSASGHVVNVNPDSTLHRVILTITAGSVTLDMPVFCYGTTAAQPPATDAPATDAPASEPPATQPPSGSGGVAVGKQGTIANVPNGVFVRSSPNIDGNNMIASLFNGDPVTVLEDVGNGWYKIEFAGVTGPTQGYIKGDYISTN